MHFWVCVFIRTEIRCLFQIVGAVTTYLVILVQFQLSFPTTQYTNFTRTASHTAKVSTQPSNRPIFWNLISRLLHLCVQESDSFSQSTRCNCLIEYMHCVYITVATAAYCTRVFRTICKFLSCQYQDDAWQLRMFIFFV